MMIVGESSSVARAKAILRGATADAQEAINLARQLKRERKFGYGRKVLDRIRRTLPDTSPLYLELAQLQALCTYKDPDLPADARLDRAQQILREADDPVTSTNQETLGLAGAIEKRKWEVDGQLQHLERALAHYLRGYQQGVAGDHGYTANNAAYVLDLLAHQERTEATKAGCTSDTARLRARRAKKIRQQIIRELLPISDQNAELKRQWWFLVTMAEAFFGMDNYGAAREWLQRAASLDGVADWERESTARQLAQLALLREGESDSGETAQDTAPWGALRALLGDHVPALRSVFLGKVGLALSGGGFRASFFHIGVLARLAEMDVLRHVEVLSCVSGGSIIGAHYYLEVRNLLQTKTDGDIQREDYIKIVERIADMFLAGVQRNIRTRVAAELLTNIKMIFKPNYSRTQRAGELYEREIYARVPDGMGEQERYMDELLIKPLNAEPEFEPKHHNWLRRAKVPILVLNATTLNTGHNWQFTARWMGEPPGQIDTDVDTNDRLRRMYYSEAPEQHRKIRLGHAVAASACVPGIFEPLELADLYPDRTVRLVDGGVHDNQGIAALLEQECTVVLVSDASGQMSSETNPSAGFVGVPLRSNSILMARVREEQYEELAARRRAALLRGLMFIHLKRDLTLNTVDWIGCTEAHSTFGDGGPASGTAESTRYGIPKQVQERLAAIRTDLDSFCDVEAFALMTSGYRMTEFEFPRCITSFPDQQGPSVQWKFLRIEEPLRQAVQEGGNSNAIRILTAARSKTFKIWQLVPVLQVLAYLLGLLVLVAAIWFYREWGTRSVITVGRLMILAAITAAGFLLGKAFKRAMQVVRYRKTLSQVATGLGMAMFGWLAARMHLHLFDKLYLWWGSIKRISAQAK